MAWWAWIVLGIVCIAMEVHFTHDFSLFCVGASAFIVAAIAMVTSGPPHWSQWIVFAALSVIILLAVRKPLLGRFQAHRGRDADFQYLIGEVARPDDDLAANAVGRAELRGSSWSARNGEGVGLRKGQRCRVERVEGLTVWLKAE
jgi:membrane protein implicated in regulation of membrane protease activity